MTGRVECKLPRWLEDGSRVVAFEDRPRTGEVRRAVAVVEGRDLDCVTHRWPSEGVVFVCLGAAEVTYDDEDRFDRGPWWYVELGVDDRGAVVAREVRWPDDAAARRKVLWDGLDERDLDWDFDDGDGVESVRVHLRSEPEVVDVVVPLWCVPDERELQVRSA